MEHTKKVRSKNMHQLKEKWRKLQGEMMGYGEHELAAQYEKARNVGIDLEQRRRLKGISRDDGSEKIAALATARNALALFQERTELGKINLGLTHRIAEIRASALSDEERSLSIELAKLEAERERGLIAQENREAFAETLGEGIGGALGAGAGMLAEMDQQLAELNRPARFKNIIRGFQSLQQTVPAATKEFALLGKTSNTMGQDIATGVTAGLSVAGPATAAFIDNVRDQALVMGAFEAAMAIAMSFVNTAAAISHGVASGMFFAMAGVAASMPTEAAGETAAGGGGLLAPAPVREEEEAQAITVNLGPGTIFGMPQEMGREIAERIASLSGSGMQSTAF